MLSSFEKKILRFGPEHHPSLKNMTGDFSVFLAVCVAAASFRSGCEVQPGDPGIRGDGKGTRVWLVNQTAILKLGEYRTVLDPPRFFSKYFRANTPVFIFRKSKGSNTRSVEVFTTSANRSLSLV